MKLLLKNQRIPDFAKTNYQQNWPIYPGAPRQLRFDGKVGKFRIGSKEVIGSILAVTIFNFRWMKEDRFGRPTQQWLDLALVDREGRVGILPLKKDSAVNVFEFLSDCFEDGLHSYSLRCYLEPKAVAAEDGQTYFVLTVPSYEFIEQERFAQLEEFVRKGRFDWILTGEVDEP